MNSTVIRILTFLLSIFLIAYVAFQMYVVFYDPYVTKLVNLDEYVKTQDLNGFFVRKEQVIPHEKSGTISYSSKNGEKIAKNSVIATAYTRESDLYSLIEIEKLSKRKKVLEDLETTTSAEGAKIDILNKQLSQIQLELIKESDTNDFDNINKTYLELLECTNKIDKSINSESFVATIAGLDKKINDLKTTIAQEGQKKITSKESGYFGNKVDGYEDILTYEKLKTMSVAQAKGYLNEKKEQKSNYIGKLLATNEWYFVAPIDGKDVINYKKGHELTLRFSNKEISTTIVDVKVEAETNEGLLILKGEYLDDEFTTARFEKPVAVIGRYTGVFVPKDAIRIVDGKKGVYVLIGNMARFRFVEEVYEDEYQLISKASDNLDYVTNYDNVIIKGKGLH